MTLLPLQRMQDRVETAKRTNDDAYFRDLMLLGEMTLKVAIAGMIASIVEDPKRNQYRLKYFAVRHGTPGGWTSIMDEMRIQISKGVYRTVIPGADDNEFTQLTKKTGPGDWQYDCVDLLFKCLDLAGYTSETLGTKPRAYDWFHRFSELRNKARSHRAPFTAITSAMCPLLQESINLFLANFSIFERPWCRLVRSINGTYQVVRWTGSTEGFSKLQSNNCSHYVNPEGVYIEFPSLNGEQTICRVDLMEVSSNGMDMYLPNGNFNENHYEMLSYVDDDTKQLNSMNYLLPPTELPESETQGKNIVDISGRSGDTIENIPKQTVRIWYPEKKRKIDYIAKSSIDNEHRIITLNGRGGIGKTWLTLEVLHRVAEEEFFDFILWFSARSIDLLTDGPKPVKPHIQTKQDVADEFSELLGSWIINDDSLSGSRQCRITPESHEGTKRKRNSLRL